MKRISKAVYKVTHSVRRIFHSKNCNNSLSVKHTHFVLQVRQSGNYEKRGYTKFNEKNFAFRHSINPSSSSSLALAIVNKIKTSLIYHAFYRKAVEKSGRSRCYLAGLDNVKTTMKKLFTSKKKINDKNILNKTKITKQKKARRSECGKKFKIFPNI